jgi:hypothetical protein
VRYYLPRVPADVFSDRLTRERASAWEQTIRTTCEALADAPPVDMEAASVTVTRGAEGEVALLCGLVEELAAEYGLEVSFKLGNESFTARFIRPSEKAIESP